MTRYVARIPMVLDVPEAMHYAIKDVLEGEYEAHYDGKGLEILDVGGNCGSFALWASARWPGSHVTSYEPHPETFKLMMKNAGGRKDITPVNAALFPAASRRRRSIRAMTATANQPLPPIRVTPSYPAHRPSPLRSMSSIRAACRPPMW